jgi:sterol desaturase/sphingolipid hydroxylase (fatty acid hydroxylase superfamily)
MFYLIGLAITEVVFTIAHRGLHKYFPEIHKLHHCCLYPSFTSNLIFDLCDFAIELYLPLSAVILYEILL